MNFVYQSIKSYDKGLLKVMLKGQMNNQMRYRGRGLGGSRAQTSVSVEWGRTTAVDVDVDVFTGLEAL